MFAIPVATTSESVAASSSCAADEHLAADGLAGPQRAVAERLDLTRRVADDVGRREVELPGPHADPAEPLTPSLRVDRRATYPLANDA